MNKGDSGGLLSKVVRFVKHPTVNWSELDDRLPGAGTQQDRQALKAAIERKRRNDQIRRREFEFLREALARKRAQQNHVGGVGVTDGQGNSSPPDSDKARTIEKIARIEAQMAQHWLDRQAGEGASGESGVRIGSGTHIPAKLEGGLTLPRHLQSHSLPTRPMTAALPIDMLVEDGSGTAHASEVPRAVEEAAVRFANGEDDLTEKSLRALMAQEVSSPVARMAWLSLLDMFHGQGNLERFEEAAAEYAEAFASPVPRWPGSVVAEAVTPPSQAEAALTGGHWACPPFLDLDAVRALETMIALPGDIKWLDWTDLVSADVAGAEALLAAVQRWLPQSLSFRFLGAGVLRRRLKASTPSGRRENDPVWWHLRLALLRLMRRADEFDLAALDFCVTYGVLPPAWELPVCAFELADKLPADFRPTAPLELDVPTVQEPIRPLVTQLGGLDVLEWPAMAGDTQLFSQTQIGGDNAAMAAPDAPPRPILTGVLQGDMGRPLADLQRALDAEPSQQVFTIDCQGLRRVDFVAAGSLLQWLLAAISRGTRVELHNVSRLVAAFFHVVGIDEAVTVRLRQY
jgi:ABC-type transporter Mla MlaB component